MIIHNRDIFVDESMVGSGIVDNALSIINGVIQHKDAIRDVVSIGKDVVSIGKDIATSTIRNNVSPEGKENPVEEVPEDVKSIIRKIKRLQSAPTGGALQPPGQFKYI